MPYIKQAARRALDTGIEPGTSGELNYRITQLLNTYLNDVGVSYQRLNDCIGVLECAKLELYRRIAAPYEDRKRNENGDVYSDEVKRDG